MNFEKRKPKKDRESKEVPGLLSGKQMLQAGAFGLSLVAGTMAYEKAKELNAGSNAGVYEAVRDDKRLALPMFAMLARGYLSKPIQLLADPALRYMRSIDPAAVVPLTTRAAGPSFVAALQTERATHDANPNDRAQPDEKRLAQGKQKTRDDQKAVFADAISKYKRDPIQLGQSIAMVSRNISWNQYPMNYSFGSEDHGSTARPPSGTELSPRQVQAEVSAVLKERQRLHEADPLAQRDVILLSNNEAADNGKRFGSAALVSHLQYVVATSSRNEAFAFKKVSGPQSIKAPASYTFQHITTRADSSARELSAAKQSALRGIENGARKTSFLFDGHGSESGLYLSNGQVQGSSYAAGEFISVEEVANSLAKRWFNQKRSDPKATTLNISLILGSCTSQNFIRNLAAKLESLGVPLPQVMVSSSEYGQYGFTDTRVTYNSQFWTWIINSDSIGSMIERKGEVKDQTPAIFTPRPEKPTKLMQLGGVVLPQPDSQSA